MRTVNKVILIGNLTRDPVKKETQGGQVIVTFGLATNREWNTEGEHKVSTEYHDCVAWARLGEICAQYLRKGKLVYIEGYLKTRSWDEQDGTKRFRTEVVVQDMIMLNKKDGGELEPEAAGHIARVPAGRDGDEASRGDDHAERDEASGSNHASRNEAAESESPDDNIF